MMNDFPNKLSGQQPRWFALRLLIPVLWAGTILWLSLTSSPPQPPGPLGWDKLQHAGAYGLLTLLLARMLTRLFHKPAGQAWLLAGVAAVGYGGLMEILQWVSYSGRTAEWGDLVADAVGALITYVIFRHIGVLPWPGDKDTAERHG